jgi:4-hydroxybenzoate polyprenyltransferase
MLTTVLLVSAVLSAGYSYILEQLKEVYHPDHIWVTVCIGNGLILATGAVCAALDMLPWAALGVFALLNVAWGTPVVIWQLWQADQRRKQRGL